MKVIQVNQTQKHRASNDTKWIEKTIIHICSYLVQRRIRNLKYLREKKEITVVFLTSNQMKKINLRYRKKNKATDILSFSSSDSRSLGELLICADVLVRQAKIQKHTFKNELQYMLVHGVLHLLGYDHEISKKEEKLMFHLQNKCFNDLLRS